MEVLRSARADIGPKPISARRARLRRRIALATGVAGILVVGLIYLHAWLISPDHIASLFFGAIERRDYQGILDLADPDEVKHLGLTAPKLGEMISECAATDGPIRMAHVSPVLLNERQTQFNRDYQYRLLDRSGKPLSDENGDPGCDVVLFNTDSGWKVGVSELLRALVFVRKHVSHTSLAGVLRRHGCPTERLEPMTNTWVQLN
jgi:hypothetical protein